MKRKIIVEIKEDRNHYALIKQDNKRENEYDYGMLIDKDQFEQLRLYFVGNQRELLLIEMSDWLMTQTKIPVEKIVDFTEYFKQ